MSRAACRPVSRRCAWCSAGLLALLGVAFFTLRTRAEMPRAAAPPAVAPRA